MANPVYAGYTTWKDQIFKGNHEPIISKEKFSLVQEQIKIRQKEAYKRNNNPRPFQSKYMLSGIMRCGLCGASFEVMLGNKRKDGTRLKKYKCHSRSSKRHNITMKKDPNGCNSPFYMMEELEYTVLSEIEKLRIEPVIIKDLAKAESGEDIKELKNRIISLDKQLEKIVTLYLDEEIPKKVLEPKKKRIVEEKDALRKKIEKIEKNKADINADEVISDLEKVDKSILNLSLDDQKILVKKLIKKILVFPDHINIYWSFVA